MANRMIEYTRLLSMTGAVIIHTVDEDMRKDGPKFIKKVIECGEKLLKEMETIFSSDALNKNENVALAFEIKQILGHIETLREKDPSDPFSIMSVAYIMGASQAISVLKTAESLNAQET